MMTPDEFVSRAVGVPWVRWGSSWDGADCYGIIILYCREVLGLELGVVPQTDIAAGFAQASGWSQCPHEPGAVGWMAWLDGRPSHCGIVLSGGDMLHSQGSEGKGGSVRVTRIEVLRRLYSDITYHRPPCS